jgi:RES domain-containing protein
MEVFRIAKEQYSKSIVASGAPNRWNLAGQQVIYAGSSRALSTLELVVRNSDLETAVQHKVMVISIADDDYLMKQIKVNQLPENWRSFNAYPELQKIGSKWYDENDSLILKVPSAIIPLEFNFVINVEHPDFKKNVRLVRTEDYFWDARLFMS